MAKFRIGDEVRIIKLDKNKEGSEKINIGDTATICFVGFGWRSQENYYKIAGPCDYDFCDEELELIHKGNFFGKEFTKYNIETGMVIELRDGFRGVVLNNVIMNEHAYISLNYFNDDTLTFNDGGNDNKFDIVKVYDAMFNMGLRHYLEDYNLTLIWERQSLKK